jgi:hypothetical protein
VVWLYAVSKINIDMKNYLIKIIIGLGLLYGGFKVAMLGDSTTSAEKIAHIETLCTNGIKVQGYLQPQYTEIDMKIGKGKTKIYEYLYTYTVAGKEYTAKVTHNLTTSAPQKDFWYNKNQPETYAADEPCQAAKNLKANKRIGSSWLYYTFGGIMMLVGYIMAWGNFKAFIRGLFKKAPNV